MNNNKSWVTNDKEGKKGVLIIEKFLLNLYHMKTLYCCNEQLKI